MDLSQYKSNSNASKNLDISVPEVEPVSNVVQGQRVPENPGRRLLSEFFADDIHNIKDYLLYDVVMPAVKNAISDTITNGIDMLLFGKTRTTFNSNTIRKVGGSFVTGGTNYSNFSKPSKIFNTGSDERRVPSYRSSYTVDDVMVYFRPDVPHNITRGEVQEALTVLNMRLRKYGMVSVADFYQVVLKAVPEDIQDHKWGWYDLSGLRTQESREGIRIFVPKNVEPIE